MKARLSIVPLAAIALQSFDTGLQAQSPQGGNRTSLLPSPAWHVVNRSISTVRENGRDIIRVDERQRDGLALPPGIAFREGDIEVDVRGRDVPQASFVGLAFHVASDSSYEVVYLRPFNFRATDSTRHAHAIQYVAEPTYGWERLRNEHPGAYEAALNPAPAPDEWVHLRVSVRRDQIQAFVNGAATPALSVKSLGTHQAGGIGIWVGNGSNGDFSNLRVTPR